MDIIFHYPPELFQLLVDTIPLLCRSKKDVLLFFRGAGVSPVYREDLSMQVQLNKDAISKYEIVRTILARLNAKGEKTLRERREILKRVVEFEDFSTCWPNDLYKAKGLVSEIRRVVNVKDSFTRMKQEREKERQSHIQEVEAKAQKLREMREKINTLKANFYAIFSMEDPIRRGKLLEGALNDLFNAYDLLLRESFKRTDETIKGTVEQLDGVVELDNEVYLAEMKWLKDPVGIDDVSHHLVRIYHRGSSRGMFFSATEFTDPALNVCGEALQKTVVILCTLEEVVRLLEAEGDFKKFLREKVRSAIIDKNPFHKILM